MSLLKNVLNTVRGAKRPLTPAVAEVAGLLPDPRPSADSAAQPAWRLLGRDAGVQAHDYPENPRLNVHALLRHEPRRALDIGCAAGAVGMGLKQVWPQCWVWGCELNPRAAQLAAMRLDHVSTTPSEQWTQQEHGMLAGVDTVLLLDVLEHMVDPWAQLQFLAQRLAPDAQVIVSLPNAGHLSVLAGLAAGNWTYTTEGILDVTHLRFFTLAEMQAMFLQTGFEIEVQSVLSVSDLSRVSEFPVQVDLGGMTVHVESAQAWLMLNAVQFGFRLKPQLT